MGESLIFSKDVESLLRQAKELNQELTGTYIELRRIDADINFEC